MQGKSKPAAGRKTTKTALSRKIGTVNRPKVSKRAAKAVSPVRGKKAKSGALTAAQRRNSEAGLKKVLPAKPVSFPESATLAHLRRPHNGGPKYFFSSDIPDQYRDTYMRALPRDPLWIFVYWEIKAAAISRLRASLGEEFEQAKWTLRVSDVTDIRFNGSNAWRTMDIEIAPGAENWYVKVWEAGRTYLVSGGLITPGGAFIESVRSNIVAMPNAGASAAVDEEWLTSESEELIGMSASSLRRSIGASERLEEAEIAAGPGFRAGMGSGSGLIL